MVMVIVSAMVETLVKHMTKKYLEKMDGIDIKGAPSWYMEPVKNQMCVFTYSRGDFGAIEVAKEKARFKMKKKLNDLIEVVVYETRGEIKNEKEREVVKRFKNDPGLGVFIKKNLDYNKVEYEDKIGTAFIRACIPTKTILFYQKDRLHKINEAVLKVKSKSAFDDLDKEFGDEKDADEFNF